MILNFILYYFNPRVSQQSELVLVNGENEVVSASDRKYRKGILPILRFTIRIRVVVVMYSLQGFSQIVFNLYLKNNKFKNTDGLTDMK